MFKLNNTLCRGYNSDPESLFQSPRTHTPHFSLFLNLPLSIYICDIKYICDMENIFHIFFFIYVCICMCMCV